MVIIEAGRLAPSQEPEGPNLTPRQKDVLNLMARGLSKKQIAEQLGISISTVNDHQRGACSFFGAANLINAVLLAHNQGLLDNEVLKSLDKNSLSKLTKRELEVLDIMTNNNGEKSSNREIGDALSIDSTSARTHLLRIKKKTKLNRMQTALLYAEAKKTNSLPPQEKKPAKQLVVLSPRQMEVLALIAKGLSRKETANQLKISISTVSAHRRALYQALGATNGTSAFRRALEIGILNLEIPATHDNASPPFREVVVYQRRRE